MYLGRFFTVLLATGVLVILPQSALANGDGIAIEAASGATLSKASGHWHRARTHLIAAIREFDKGNKLVNPTSLMDSQEWRTHITNRVVDLDRVLSPQPRVSEEGVRFSPAPELLGVPQQPEEP